ncbi:MAG TPA: hypothetical protein VMW69_15805 [Spirochaetia bacterium]|nr:hypothetical protein [Spirochaetia bacterium]
MSRKHSPIQTKPDCAPVTPYTNPVPFAGRIISRSYEPSPGWRGILTEILPNALVFRSDERCEPLLPTLLPAFCLISPQFPDSPGTARIEWTEVGRPHAARAELNGGSAPWLPPSLRERLHLGDLLEHAMVTGDTFWRIEGVAMIDEAHDAARPRLVLAPPTRRDRREVERAIQGSLYRAMRSVPPENDLKHLVNVSRSFIDEGRAGDESGALSKLSELVGYGAGRTACGDDYLVGLICGLDLSASIDIRIDPTRFHEFRAWFVGQVYRALERTSLLGRHVLLASFHGLYSTPLLDEADALSDGIIIGPGEPEWSLIRRPTVSPGWPALFGLLTGAYVVCSSTELDRPTE